MLFSDEAHIELGQHGQVWVQRPEGEAHNPDYMIQRPPRSQRLSFWACVSGKGKGRLTFFDDPFTARTYCSILSSHLLPSAEPLLPSGEWWFQQDNAPQHTALLTKQWLFRQGIFCLDFPPYSPDLNIIENVWAWLKRRVEKRNARTLEQLKRHVEEEWEQLDANFLSSLAHSMIDRIAAVKQNRGHMTGY